MAKIFGMAFVLLLALCACAYDASQTVWYKNFGGSLSSLSHGGNAVYAGFEDGRVVALTTSGSVLWEYNAGHIIKATSPASGELYAASLDGFIHAIGSDGKASWVVKTPTYVSNEKAFEASEDAVYAGLSDGFIHAYDHEGRLMWTIKTDAYVQDILVTGDGILAVSDRRVIYYSKDGQIKWNSAFSNYIRAADAGEGVVAVGLSNNQFLVYDTKGTLLVNRTLGSPIGVVAVGEDMAYAGMRDNMIRAFSLNDSPSWSLNLNNSVVALSPAGEIVAASTLDNIVYLLDSRGSVVRSVKFGGVPNEMLPLEKSLLVGTSEGEISAVILPQRKEENAVLLIFMASVAILAALILLAKSWRRPT
jgi:WD40 repeat protein